jgi:hypothetical protein
MASSVASRGTMGYAGAVLAGGISAAIFLVALNHADGPLFFVIYLAMIPVFMAGLGAGALAGMVAVAVALAGLFALEPSNYGVIYIFIYGAPAMALIALALRYRLGDDKKMYWYPEGNLLTAMTVYPCLLFLFLAAISSGHEGGLLDLTTKLISDATEPMKAQMTADDAEQFSAMISKLVVFMPAMAGVSWILVMLIDLVFAQATLQKQGWNLRNGFAIQELEIPNWLVYAVAITGLAGAGAPAPFNYLGANLSIILGVPFFFSGLAVTHAWAARQKAALAILIVFYILLCLIPLAALFVALLGVIDQWAHFRRRMRNQPGSQ